MKTNNLNIQKMVATAMLAAVAGVLMSLEFSLPLMPPFYKVDFSDVPTIIAVFLLGPASGVCVEALKILIKLVTVGTNTMYVGEFANVIGIVLFVIPISFVYRKLGGNRKAALVSLAANIPVRIAMSCCINAFITLPMYAAAMGLSVNEVVLMVSKANPAISNLTTFLVLATVPFNLIKNSLNCVIGFMLYESLKKAGISHLLERQPGMEKKKAA